MGKKKAPSGSERFTKIWFEREIGFSWGFALTLVGKAIAKSKKQIVTGGLRTV